MSDEATNPRSSRRARKGVVYGLVTVFVVIGACAVWFLPRYGYSLPTGERAASPGTVVYSTGRTLHIRTRTHRMEHSPQSMASTDGGLYYLAGGTLYRWAGGGSERVADVGSNRLSTSGDGRWLAYLDLHHGPRSWSGEHVVETVVFDTTTGDQVVRDRAGQGDFTDDLAALYQDAEPRILGFEQQSVLVIAAKGDTFQYDLSTGRRTHTDRDTDHASDPDVTNTPGGAFGLVAVKHGRARFLLHDEAGARYNGYRSPDLRHVVYLVDGIDDAFFVFAASSGGGRPVRIPTKTRELRIKGGPTAPRSTASPRSGGRRRSPPAWSPAPSSSARADRSADRWTPTPRTPASSSRTRRTPTRRSRVGLAPHPGPPSGRAWGGRSVRATLATVTLCDHGHDVAGPLTLNGLSTLESSWRLVPRGAPSAGPPV